MGDWSRSEALVLRWAEISRDPALSALPYKIELNRWGKIEMSPASFRHGRLQAAIAIQLAGRLPDGEALTDIPILTELGVRVPDVAWASHAYLAANGDASPAARAPEICIEIVSPSNPDEEMRDKTAAYLAAGALEVWLVAEDGTVQYFDRNGPRSDSALTGRLTLPGRST